MSQIEETFELPAEMAAVAPALNRLEAFLRRSDLDEATVMELRMVAEEALTNAVKYAFDDPAGHRIEIRAQPAASGIRLTFLDDGRPFDPLAQPDPDLDRPIEERPIGGLGIWLLKSLCDELAYRREAGRNVLSLRVPRASAGR